MSRSFRILVFLREQPVRLSLAKNHPRIQIVIEVNKGVADSSRILTGLPQRPIQLRRARITIASNSSGNLPIHPP